jgi:hypothetical protein
MIKTKNGFLFSLIALAAVTASTTAHAYVSLAGSLVLPKSATVDIGGGPTPLDGKLSYGGGLLLGKRLSPYWGLETGAVFLSRTYSATVSATIAGETFTSSADLSLKSLYIPVGPRIFLGRIFSLEAGGFYDIALSSGASSNYGVQGGARIAIPVGQTSSMFVEGRYDMGLKDFSGNKQSDKVLVLVGLTFGDGMK